MRVFLKLVSKRTLILRYRKCFIIKTHEGEVIITSTRGGNAVNRPLQMNSFVHLQRTFFILNEMRRIEMSRETLESRTKMKKINGDSLTPISIFRRLQGKQKFLLESHEKHKDSGRYSFIGMDPLKTFIGKQNRLEEFTYETNQTYIHEGDMLKNLKQLMPRLKTDSEFPFLGGAVGYIGYDAIREVTNKQMDPADLPEVQMNIYETVIVFDHKKNEVTILRTEIGITETEMDFDEIIDQLLNGKEEKENSFTLGNFDSSLTQNEYETLVRKGQQLIQNGEVEQIVLSRKLTADFQGDAFSIYRRLRQKNPSPYMYYMEIGESVIIGASPESLIKVTDGHMVTNPIAGTRKRTKDPFENKRMEEELKEDPKEIMEHDMLVELGQTDAKKVCTPETVHITKYQEVVHYEHVMHLVSELEGKLAPGVHPLDALFTCLPAGTVSGTPKEKAMDLIDDLEDMRRGIYGGAIGYVGFNGNIDFALTIRTMLIHEGKVYVQAGAGIVEKSNPTAEFMETEHKAKSLIDIVS